MIKRGSSRRVARSRKVCHARFTGCLAHVSGNGHRTRFGWDRVCSSGTPDVENNARHTGFGSGGVTGRSQLPFQMGGCVSLSAELLPVGGRSQNNVPRPFGMSLPVRVFGLSPRWENLRVGAVGIPFPRCWAMPLRPVPWLRSGGR